MARPLASLNPRQPARFAPPRHRRTDVAFGGEKVPGLVTVNTARSQALIGFCGGSQPRQRKI